MARLWNEELELGSPTLRLETLWRLGGAQNIVRVNLDQTMARLPPDRRALAALIFRYLVTPSGTKIAYSVGDLAAYAGVRDEQLRPLLEDLSSGDTRILRPIAPRPGDGDPHYEIFHDVLAPAILDWRNRYVLEVERRRSRRLRALSAVLSVLLVALVALTVVALR